MWPAALLRDQSVLGRFLPLSVDKALLALCLTVLSLLALTHCAAADGISALASARRINRLKQQVSAQAVDASDVSNLDSAKVELSRLRKELSLVGEHSAAYLSFSWAPWGCITIFVGEILKSLRELLEALGGPLMFRLLVNLGLRTFCSRAGMPYNRREIAARQGLASFNDERPFSWRVMDLDGRSHEQRIMAIGCDHGEMWLKVTNAWAKIYVQYWIPRVPVCGVVVYLHDYGSYSGEASQLLSHFLSRGLLVVSHDMRGHGRSSGIHGLIPSIDDLSDDLQLVLDTIATMDLSRHESAQDSVPMFLYGNAFGALLALFYAASRPDRQQHISGLVLQSPLLTLERPYTHYQGSFMNLLSTVVGTLLPAWPWQPWHLNESISDVDVAQGVVTDSMRYHGYLRAGTAKSFHAGVRRVVGLVKDVQVPVFIQHAASDVSNLLHAEQVIKSLASSEKSLVTYPATSHILMFESTALVAKVTEDAMEWIDGNISGATPDKAFPGTPPLSPRKRRRRGQRRMMPGRRGSSGSRVAVEPDGALAFKPRSTSRSTRMKKLLFNAMGYKDPQRSTESHTAQGNGLSGPQAGSSSMPTGRASQGLSPRGSSSGGGGGGDSGEDARPGSSEDDEEAEERESLLGAIVPEPSSVLPQDFLFNDEFRTSLPQIQEWPDRPVLVRCSSNVPMEILVPGKSAYGALPINDRRTPIPFETPLFKGVAMIRIADLPSSPTDYFYRKRRKMQVAIQGKFKRPLTFDNVFSGQELVKPLRNIPGRWMIKWALSLLRSRLPNTFKCDAFQEQPYFLSPLISTSQCFRADRSDPQDVTALEIYEENRLLGEAFADGAISSEARKKFFSNQETLAQYTFDPNVTYTFDYYQQFFRAGLFALDVGVKLLDLAHYVGRQPLLLTMAKTMDTNEYLWKFEVWHEKLLAID